MSTGVADLCRESALATRQPGRKNKITRCSFFYVKEPLPISSWLARTNTQLEVHRYVGSNVNGQLLTVITFLLSRVQQHKINGRPGKKRCEFCVLSVGDKPNMRFDPHRRGTNAQNFVGCATWSKTRTDGHFDKLRRRRKTAVTSKSNLMTMRGFRSVRER